jgi:hypothetical protein
VTRKVRFLWSARLELLEAIDFYEQRTEGVGLRFADAVNVVVEHLPNLQLKPIKGYESHGAFRREIGKPWPYRLVVIEHDETLFIIAVEHHKRRPGYWTSRLGELND